MSTCDYIFINYYKLNGEGPNGQVIAYLGHRKDHSSSDYVRHTLHGYQHKMDQTKQLWRRQKDC